MGYLYKQLIATHCDPLVAMLIMMGAKEEVGGRVQVEMKFRWTDGSTKLSDRENHAFPV